MGGIKNPKITDGPGDEDEGDEGEGDTQAAAGWGRAFKPYVVDQRKGAR